MTVSAFAKYNRQIWPYAFTAELQVGTIAGGIPTDPKVAEAWLKTKLGTKDDLLREQVAQIMVERNVTKDEATQLANDYKNLNGFKRDKKGLYIEGRQVKAAIKEAANVAVAAGTLNGRGWGKTNKGLLGFVAEHVQVVEDRIHLGVMDSTGIMQRFVHTWRGDGIQYEEYVEDATLTFTVETDWEFSEAEWAAIWLTGERQGIGASRSQGYGKYTVAKWAPKTASRRRTAA